MNPVTVAFIISSLNPGGVEGKLVAVVKRLDRSRFRPLVCCLHAGGKLAREFDPDILCEGLLRAKGDVAILPRLIRLFRRERVQIVFTLGAYDAGWWGRWAAWMAQVPVIIMSLHRTDMLNGKPAVDPVNRLLTPITDAFVAMSERHRDYLVNVEKLPADRLVVIPNGVDLETFYPLGNREQFKSQLGLPSSSRVVGIVAGLRPEKAHDVFLQAAALCRERFSDAYFVLAGDGPLRSQVEAWCQQQDLTERVLLLGNRMDMPTVYAAMDVVVLCSHNENFPNTLLEAMAMELPVVATPVGSIPDIVVDQETGLLVPPRDAQSLAAALINLLEDPQRAQAMGRAGRERVERLFTMERMVFEREELFERLLRSKGKRVAWSGTGAGSRG